MNIEQLIKKFYEGVSTPEEERLLTEYFLNEENVDERWTEGQQLFRLLHDTQIRIPAGVSERLDKLIMQQETPQKPPPRKQMWLYRVSSAAAVALLCIGLFFAIRKPSPPRTADTFKDPKEAALVAEQTLAYMSVQLNKGLDKAAGARQEFEKANQILNKHLK
jgi:hypothetical protein